MTFSDLLRLLRHYLKIAIAIPIACVVITVVVTLLAPSTYEAKATLITDADIALAGGFAQVKRSSSLKGIAVTPKLIRLIVRSLYLLKDPIITDASPLQIQPSMLRLTKYAKSMPRSRSLPMKRLMPNAFLLAF